MFGGWTIDYKEYAADVRRFRDEVGKLAWAAPQDWMCEPHMLELTGLSITEHQRRTVENYCELRSYAPDLPIIPVLQGWTIEDFLACVAMYERAEVHLASLPLVGIGSVCRRQATSEIETITYEIASLGISLHGFGVKLRGMLRYSENLESSDSLAWSFKARQEPPMPGHVHRNCANCLDYAEDWYYNVWTIRTPLGSPAAMRG